MANKQCSTILDALTPQGLVPENVFYFNHENIDEVVFEGFKDGEEDRFQKLFSDWKQENEAQFKRGKVTESLQ